MKKDEPLVCITLPVYNEEKVLETSVDKLRLFLKKDVK